MTAVLLLAYNRADLTAQVCGRVKDSLEARVYLSVDGPVSGSPADALRVRETVTAARDLLGSSLVAERIGDANLGCANGVYRGLTWFFAQEAEGIVLEDDCLPSQEFFLVASHVLREYRNDPRIGAFCGTNFAPHPRTASPLLQSKFYQLWGWAAWRRSIDGFQLRYSTTSLLRVKETRFYKDLGLIERRDWRRYFSVASQPNPSTWDYQFVLHQWLNNRHALLPRASLVENIGFAGGAHYSGSEPAFYRKVQEAEVSRYYARLSTESAWTCATDAETERWISRNLYSPSVSYRLKHKLEATKRRALGS